MKTILFENKEYQIQELSLPEFGDVLISTTTLNDSLLTGGDYISKAARELDEAIFYFVEPNEINLSKKQLSSIVIQQIK